MHAKGPMIMVVVNHPYVIRVARICHTKMNADYYVCHGSHVDADTAMLDT